MLWFFFFTPKVTGNLQITHPFPGTLAGKKSRGLTIFLQTHTHTKEPCKDLNTSCACPCQNFLNPPPFTLACQAMQIFERPPRFRSVRCKNPHRIQAVKAVTHSYSAARSPARQAKLLYSRRSLEHTLAHLSHRLKECNRLEKSPACLAFLKSNAKKQLPSRQRTGWHRYGILGKEKWNFVSAAAEIHSTSKFCCITWRPQPRETWVRRPDFSFCLHYCPAVWSWVSHSTTPGNKVLLWWLMLGNSLDISKNMEERGDICSQVPGWGENSSMLLQGQYGRWVVRKQESRDQSFDSHQDVNNEFLKIGTPLPPHTHTWGT